MALLRSSADPAGFRYPYLSPYGGVLGLVTRRRDPQNRRLHLVELTPAGDALFARLRDAATAFDERLRTGLSQPDVVQLEELLDRLRDNVS